MSMFKNSFERFSPLFRIPENASLSRQSVADKFEKSMNRVSSKPFSVFYQRLEDKPDFVDKYKHLKAQKYGLVVVVVVVLF